MVNNIRLLNLTIYYNARKVANSIKLLFFCLFILSPCYLCNLRVREEITLHFQESRRPRGKARGGRIASYLTDEQRSQAGWIGSLNCEVIFERALSNQSSFTRTQSEYARKGISGDVSGEAFSEDRSSSEAGRVSAKLSAKTGAFYLIN